MTFDRLVDYLFVPVLFSDTTDDELILLENKISKLQVSVKGLNK